MTNPASTALSKLPALTISFWIMKIAATTLGETGADLLTVPAEEPLSAAGDGAALVRPLAEAGAAAGETGEAAYGKGVLIFFGVFLVALFFQLRSRKYHPFLYWSVILATSTAGTAMSDYMDRTLELGYGVGSAILIALLLGTLAYWRVTEKSLSVTEIRSPRVELLYWITILFSNTLGTALGDYISHTGLGFMRGAMVFGGVITVVALAYFFTKISRVALFWIAFILTRPFGAELGDVFSKSRDEGGLGMGTLVPSLVLAAILIGVILCTMWRDPKVEPAAEQ